MTDIYKLVCFFAIMCTSVFTGFVVGYNLGFDRSNEQHKNKKGKMRKGTKDKKITEDK